MEMEAPFDGLLAITGMRGLMMKVGVGVSVLVVNGSADVIISNA